MSVLHRHREFGVLQALGLTPWQTGSVVLAEGLLQTVVCALIGVAVGLGITAAFSGGIDMSNLYNIEEMQLSGVSLDPVIIPIVKPVRILQILGFMLFIGVVSSVYPAMRASTIDVTDPGRRAGAVDPRPEVDEHYAASAPAACPDCGGAVAVSLSGSRLAVRSAHPMPWMLRIATGRHALIAVVVALAGTSLLFGTGLRDLPRPRVRRRRPFPRVRALAPGGRLPEEQLGYPPEKLMAFLGAIGPEGRADYILFLWDPSLDATNWRAEQAIRPAVVIRKVCGGNAPATADTQQVLASV